MKELKEAEAKLQELLPEECALTKIEAEGPQIVVYLENPRAFYEHEGLISRLASAVRRKVSVRSDPSILKSPEESKKLIASYIPPEAGVKSINFSPEFNEVVIEAEKPGLAIGKRGIILKTIFLETGWSPKILRVPTTPSEIETAIRGALLKNAAERKKFLLSLGKKLLKPPEKCEWVKVTALGGFREVGRSCVLLQTPSSNVLLDCGINTSANNSKAYPLLNSLKMSLDQIDAVVVSHAHLDHSGFIPYLFKYGYEGPVYATPPTRDLMVMLQEDAIRVLNIEGNGAPYGERDIKKELIHVITREYGEVTDLTSDIRFTFYNAGHILGSSITHLHIGEGKHNLVYTGDIKYGKMELFDSAVTHFPRLETLIIESTYGSRKDVFPPREQCEKNLVDAIRKTIERKGKVLIPVFAVGRAQEIMLVLEHYFNENELKVYLDGMSKEASSIHTVYPEYLKRDLKRRILTNDSPFDRPIFKHITNPTERKEIVEGDEPCVILAPSGMLEGGPSLEILRMLAPDKNNTLIFVGYTAPTSLARKLQRGEREVPLLNSQNKLDTVKVEMEVLTVEGFSGHCDNPELISFVRSLRPKPKKVYTLHGEEKKCEEFARTINKILRVETRVPMLLDSFRIC